MNEIVDKAKKIKLAIFDIDGVLTSGKLIYSPNGIEYKDFHVHDGQGIKLLQKSGIEIGIITACQSETVKKRMQDLGVTHVYQGQTEKLAAYCQLKQKLQLLDEEIAYMGDDLPDLAILCRVGLSVTVPNAPAILKETVCLVTKKKGGNGAARELCELIMKAQNTYQSITDSFFYRE